MKKLLFAVFTAAIMLMLNTSAWTQTVLVNYAFNDAAAATPCNPGTSNATGGVTPTFTTSTGTCTAPGGTATTGTAFTQNTTAGFSVSLTGFATGATNYFQFQLSGLSNFQNFQVYLQTQRSGTGPTTGDLQYSTDGTTFTSFQTVTVPTTFAGGGAFNFDLSAIAAINNQSNVYFRFVGSGGSNAAGTIRIDNFQVQALRPTAAGADIAGRVTTANGRGIQNAVLMLSGNGLREPVYVRTTTFGNYKFSNIPSGETYVVSVMAKNYIFESPSRVISLGDNFTNADFTANK